MPSVSVTSSSTSLSSSPSSLNLLSTPSTGQMFKKYRQRQKARRKQDIKDRIEEAFNWKGQNMPTGDQAQLAMNQVSQMPVPPLYPVNPSPTLVNPSSMDFTFTERVQSFFPECDVKETLMLQVPENANQEALFFQIKFPAARPGAELSLKEAKLRMFKLGVPSPSPNLLGRHRTHHNHRPKMVRITVSWLKLRKNSFRTAEAVMVDSVMTDSTTTGWVSLDVTPAVRTWQRHPKMASAVIVEVEDSSKRPLTTAKYLQGLRCSPHHVLGPSPPMSPLQSPKTGSGNIPLIDINTIEVPRGQVPESYNLPLFGMNNEYSTPWVQNVEIHHKTNTSDNLVTQNSAPCAHNCSTDEDQLLTLEEVDYMSSSADPTPPSSPRPITGGTTGGHQPIRKRLVMSGEDYIRLTANSESLTDVDKMIREQEMEEMFRNLLTKLERDKVFGQNL